jgi:hypothetical protein
LLYALYNLKLTGGSISDISYDGVTTNTYGAFTSIPSTWIINGSGVSAIDLYFTIGAISTAQAKAWKRIAGSADAWSMIDVFAYNTVTEPYFGSKDKVSIPAQALKNGAKGSYEYTLSGDDQTLPIELSSFTAVTTAEYFVELHWITQSETDVSGYYVFRSLEDNVSSAIQVSTFIPATNTSTEAEYSYVDEEVMPNTTYFYWLQNMDMNGDITYHGPVTVHVNDNNGGGTPEIPLLTSLQKVYPNPFFNSATISYGLAKNEAVTIEIYNVKGSKVRTLVSSTKASGNYRETWNSLDSNGNACPSGVYYIKMTAGKYTTTQKAVLVK